MPISSGVQVKAAGTAPALCRIHSREPGTSPPPPGNTHGNAGGSCRSGDRLILLTNSSSQQTGEIVESKFSQVTRPRLSFDSFDVPPDVPQAYRSCVRLRFWLHFSIFLQWCR